MEELIEFMTIEINQKLGIEKNMEEFIKKRLMKEKTI